MSTLVERLTFREVTAARWPDLVRLFEGRGGPRHCWCMVWRATPEERRRFDGRARRKAALARRIRQRIPIGILAYLDGEPVAWCSIAPRETYLRLGVSPADHGERIWSLVCFFVISRLRQHGVMRRLIQAAVAHARKHGAMVVEAYPVDPDSPSYRFMGFVPAFTAAGFHEVGRAGTRRHVMRLQVR